MTNNEYPPVIATIAANSFWGETTPGSCEPVACSALVSIGVGLGKLSQFTFFSESRHLRVLKGPVFESCSSLGDNLVRIIIYCLVLGNSMPLSELETRGIATLFLIVYGPNFQGKTKFKHFLKLKKCSSSTISFCRINSKKKILGVKKASMMYGRCVKQYCLMVVSKSKRN